MSREKLGRSPYCAAWLISSVPWRRGGLGREREDEIRCTALRGEDESNSKGKAGQKREEDGVRDNNKRKRYAAGMENQDEK